MLSKQSVKLNRSLCARSMRAAAKAGYSSVEEFIEHAIEKELVHHEEAENKDDLAKKLKGLGYLE